MSLNLTTLLRTSARRHPHRPALLHGNARVDYASLDARSQRVAGALRALGVRRGDRVALLLPNVPDFTACYFACHYLGAVVVPLNVLLVAEEIAYHLRDADAAALIAWHGLAAAAQEAWRQVDGCRHLLVAGGDSAAPAPAVSLDAAAASAAPVLEMPDTTAEDTAVILYTSGTTGHPKGAELTQFNLFCNADYVAHKLTPIDETSVALTALPLFHSFGQTVLQNAHVAAGGALVLMPRFEPGAALALMASHGVNYFAGVPTMYLALLHDLAQARDKDTAAARGNAARGNAARGIAARGIALRYCLAGGAPMPVQVMSDFDAAFGVDILEGYGLSETSPVACFNVLGQPKKPGSVGVPINGVEFRLVDAQGRVVTAPGEPGEICIKGHNVMKGYFRRPDATAAAIQDGWFRTGDIATRDHDGAYFIVDRVKDMVLRGGFNVYPREVEEVLYRHAAVLEAAVVGVPDARLGEEVVAFVVLRPDHQTTAAELIEYCKAHVAAYKYPRRIELRAALPKGPTGKILKRELRRWAAEGGGGDSGGGDSDSGDSDSGGGDSGGGGGA